ncbi:TRM11 family methyltransferase [Acuticoccus sediminis]|uniref:hypothetical protein n=1 Tax=Acuticoccus sediminis TaxID=2184697 RepID=UPI001CFD45FF|nr:hypothetical protein [Acuticoccus sediminis]
MSAATKNAHVWEQDELNWYVEPTRATEQLLGVERFTGRILDPCCGQGNIVTTLLAAGYDAIGSDIVDRTGGAPWFQGKLDALKDYGFDYLAAADCPNIIMNPPFYRAKGAEAFIRLALSSATGKVAAFVDARFIFGADRATGLYAEYPPHRVWIITPRVSCPPGSYLAAGNKAGGGSADWCWLVYDMTAPFAGTRLGWLRK